MASSPSMTSSLRSNLHGNGVWAFEAVGLRRRAVRRRVVSVHYLLAQDKMQDTQL